MSSNSRTIHGQQSPRDVLIGLRVLSVCSIMLIGFYCGLILTQQYEFPKLKGVSSKPAFSVESFNVALGVVNSSSDSSQVIVTADWNMGFFLKNPYWSRRILYQQLDVAVLYNTSNGSSTNTTTESLGEASIKPFVLKPDRTKLVRASQKLSWSSSDQSSPSLSNRIIDGAETINFNVQIHARTHAFWVTDSKTCTRVGSCGRNRNLKHEIWLNCDNLGVMLSSTSKTTASGSMLPGWKGRCTFR